MVDRLRLLLDRPLDPLVARAVVVFAGAILLGFAAIFVLGVSESGRPASAPEPRVPRRAQPSLPEVAPVEHPGGPRRPPHHRRQDPQDEKGSAAGRRAAKALRSHRALQHLPYRQGRLSVQLVGARGRRALLQVSAPTVVDARQGWRAFLRRYRDDGHAYLPRFQDRGGDRG